MMDKKIRIGVLMGGKSIEREVSFNSGRTICDHIDAQQFCVIPLFQTVDNRLFILPWRFLYRGKIDDFLYRLNKEAQEISWDQLKRYIDLLYIALHGRFAEDGTIQGFLNILGVPYIGSGVYASALSMDKAMQKAFLALHNIETPHDVVVQPQEINVNVIKKIIQAMKLQTISFPCIVKPVQEGSSLGVRVVQEEAALLEALIFAARIHPGMQQAVLIEEFIKGMEFTCIILEDLKTGEPFALAPTEIVLENGKAMYDYEQKYMPGKSLKFTPARCTKKDIEKIQKTCVAVKKALGIEDLARIDGFLKKDGEVVIIDPNAFSGTAPSSFFFKQAAEAGMSHTEVINHIIKTGIEKYHLNIVQHKKNKVHGMKKKRIAVLFGGRSHEKEISLESGRNIIYKLSPYKYEIISLFVNKDLQLYHIDYRLLVCNKTDEIEQALTKDMHVAWHDLPKKCDFAFIGLHGGEGENGSVQGTLEMLGIPYNGSGVLTSALCMDKYKTAQFLQAKGFSVSTQMLFTKKEWHAQQKKILDRLMKRCTFPLIVKPHDDGCSVFVKKIKNQKQLVQAINTLLLEKDYALVEEYIDGMELTVGILGNDEPKALPPSQAVAVDGVLSIEEKFLPGQGQNITPAPLAKKTLLFVKKTIEKAYKALQCKGYARIDCFYQSKEQSVTGKERVIILEVNTLPGLTPATCIFHQAAEIGIKPMEFIDKVIELGLQAHQKVSTVMANKSKQAIQ